MKTIKYVFKHEDAECTKTCEMSEDFNEEIFFETRIASLSALISWKRCYNPFEDPIEYRESCAGA